MDQVSIGLAFIAGFVSFISPCVLPLVPAYIGYMGGRMTQTVALQTADGKIENRSSVLLRLQLLSHSVAFVLGFTFVFVLIGLATTAFASVLGSSISIFTDIIGRVGGLMIILFGIHFMGIVPNILDQFRKRENLISSPLFSIGVAVLVSLIILWAFIVPIIAVPIIAAFLVWLVLGGAITKPSAFWTNFMDKITELLYSDTRREMTPKGEGQGLLGSAMMGVIFSAGWTPCIGPTLGVVLTLAATTGNVGSAIPLLTAYSLGLGIPFILTALLLNSAQGLLFRLNQHMRTIQLVSGGILVVVGITIASGQLQALSSRLVTGEFTEFTSRVEECVVGTFEGDVYINQLGSCIGGELTPVALNQSASGILNADVSQLEYIFHAEANTPVDVIFTRVDDNVAPVVTLKDADGNELASNNDVTIAQNGDTIALRNITLPVGQIYTVTVSHGEGTTFSDDNPEASFRIRVREAEEVTESTNEDGVEIIESGTFGGTSDINSITDLVESLDATVGVNIGEIAPNFTLVTDTGDEVSLNNLRGQNVLLNFWGTWCGPCRREMPEFQRAYENYQDDGFTILAVAVRDTVPNVQEFRDEFGLTFTLAMDNGTADRYGIVSQPSSLMIDENGIIIAKHLGLMTEEQLDEFLAAAEIIEA